MLAATLIASLAGAPDARGAAGADSTSTHTPAAVASDSTRAATPPDTLREPGIQVVGGRAVADTTGRTTPRFLTPRWVMLRSLVIPGWGQLTNGSWLKALAVAGVEVGLGVAMVNDVHEMDRLLGDLDRARANKDPEAELNAVNAYNDRQNTLVAREWLLGGAVAYALMDAYVDAHFRRFKVEFRRGRPLPEGAQLPTQARVSVGWAF